MFCKNCGKNIEGSAAFCPNCGSAVTPVATIQQENPVVTPTENIVPSESPILTSAEPQKKPKKKGKKIAIAIIAIILVGAIVAGSFVITKTSDPLYKLSKAFERMAEYNNFTFNAELSVDGEDVEFNAAYSKEDNAYIAEIEMPYYYEDSDIKLGLYNNRMLADIDMPDLEQTFYIEINENATNGEFNLEAMLDTIKSSMSDGENDATEYLEQFVKTDELPGAIEALTNKLTENFKNEEWLVDVMGYTAEKADKKTKITFTPDLEELYDIVTEEIYPVLSREARESIRYQEEDILYTISEIECEINITINGNDLESLEFEVIYDDYEVATFEFALKDINKTSVDIDTLKDMNDDAVSFYDGFIAPMYGAVTDNAIKKTCASNRRNIISQIVNNIMSNPSCSNLKAGESATFVITTNETGDDYSKITGADHIFNGGSETFLSLFNENNPPICPIPDSSLRVEITADDNDASMVYVTVTCSHPEHN